MHHYNPYMFAFAFFDQLTSEFCGNVVYLTEVILTQQ